MAVIKNAAKKSAKKAAKKSSKKDDDKNAKSKSPTAKANNVGRGPRKFGF